jgi:5-methylcytosine-specific restriction endonuclease McrA
MRSKKHDVLVLNKSWVAIHIIDWQRCMSLILQEAAQPVDRDFILYSMKEWMDFSLTVNSYSQVQTIKQHIAIPEIIVLKKYNKLPVRDVKYSRQTLFQRDKFTCGYCGEMFDRNDLTIDHIIPKSRGGTSNWNNAISCCKPCNSFKADRTPDEAHMPLLLKPKKPVWLSPLSEIKPNHPCKTWHKFMDRTLVDIGE